MNHPQYDQGYLDYIDNNPMIYNLVSSGGGTPYYVKRLGKGLEERLFWDDPRIAEATAYVDGWNTAEMEDD